MSSTFLLVKRKMIYVKYIRNLGHSLYLCLNPIISHIVRSAACPNVEIIS